MTSLVNSTGIKGRCNTDLKNTFPETLKEGTLSNLFYETRTTLTPQFHQVIKMKENERLTSLMNT